MSRGGRKAIGGDGDIFRRAWGELNAPPRHPKLREAAALLESGRLAGAEKVLRGFLNGHPRDAVALRLLAQIALRQERPGSAEPLLQQCLQLNPGFAAARFDYASLLLLSGRPQAAMSEANGLIEQEPANPLFRRLIADALEAIGDYGTTINLWREMIDEYPDRPECWLRYGNALRAQGSTDESVAAFRKAVALDPAFTPAWVSLADLKTFRFDKDDILRMESQFASAELPKEDRTNLHFALGKAYADARLFEKSFNNFARGNAIRRLEIEHDPDVLTAFVSKCRRVFTPRLFRAHAGSGCPRPDPIFLVGMPRAGSTLVEQILASHSQIEGVGELAQIATVWREIQEVAAQRECGSLELLGRVDSDFLRTCGERYVEGTLVHRTLGRPYFTDKMGANFVHTGLIHLILPNAKIIDVRRHPMACCFSNFSQMFPTGQNNAYRLADLARLYHDYVALMAHFDATLPGRIYRIFYEALVADPEAEIRRLLDYLGMPFDDSCLTFFKTRRAVTTVSSEQVRRPIYHDALENWKNYEPWLGGLKTALGPVLDLYPGVPSFD